MPVPHLLEINAATITILVIKIGVMVIIKAMEAQTHIILPHFFLEAQTHTVLEAQTHIVLEDQAQTHIVLEAQTHTVPEEDLI